MLAHMNLPEASSKHLKDPIVCWLFQQFEVPPHPIRIGPEIECLIVNEQTEPGFA